MGYDCWTLVMLVLMFPVLVKGHEACFDNKWHYHSPTHSCFRLFTYSVFWPQARDLCAEVELGRSSGVQTRLAKIDDKNTNAFIITLFPGPLFEPWIGLHYDVEKRVYRWDGYPDETPKFMHPNWRDLSPSRRYVTTGISGWRGEFTSRESHFVCQHRAKVISSVTCQQQTEAKGLEITCRSGQSPVKAKCEWSYKYVEDTSYGEWRPVKDPSYRQNCDSFTTTCSVTLSNVRLGVIAFRMKMYPVLNDTSDLSTNQIALSEAGLSEAGLNITVAKPTDVRCHRELYPNSLVVSCQMEKIYPEALCRWSHRYEADQTFNPVSPIGMPTYTHEVYTDSDGSLYYKSECSMTLTPDITTFRPGNLTVQITVNPNIEGIDQNTASDAFFISQEIVKIGPAKLNKFTVNGREADIEVDLDDILTFSCTADGLPQYSIAIRKLDRSYVDTSFWQSSNSESSEVRRTVIARCDHNGRYRCSLHNAENHQDEFRDLDIRVRCPPTYCNETSRDLKMAVRPGKSHTVELCIMAYPMPDFSLLKDSESEWIRPKDIGDEQITRVRTLDYHQDLTISLASVQPSDLGEYALHYTFGSSPSFSGLYFQLTAPLTYCYGEEGFFVHQVRLGDSATLEMCLTAFPSPSKLHMQIMVKGTAWQDYSGSNVAIKMDVDYKTLTNVQIFFLEVKATDVGEYRLYDPQQVNGSARSFIKFFLDTESPCMECSSGISIGTIVGVVIASYVVVVALTMLSMIAFRKRRSKNEPNANPNNQSGPNDAGFDKPKQEATDSDYVDVPEDFVAPGRDFREPSGQVLENGAYEGYELQSSEGTTYETIKDTAGDRQKKELYDLLHPDDPNYINLNREPQRKYVTIGPDEEKGSLGVYDNPNQLKNEIDLK